MTAAALESGSTVSRVARIWYPVVGSIAVWLVHLVYLSSIVRAACTDDLVWSMHAVTAACVLATVAGLVLAHRLTMLDAGEGPEGHRAARRLRFLGRLGLLVGAVNLLLILAEGALVEAVPVCA